MSEVVRQRRPVRSVTMADAVLNSGQTLYAVNGVFIGRRSHVSARYTIAIAGREEREASSGVIVSTGLGSTGWLRSSHAGWHATTRTLLHQGTDAAGDGSFAWDADYLHYFVREPCPSRITQSNLVSERSERDQCLVLVSQMPENGVIVSDGIEADHLDVNSGTESRGGVAAEQGLPVA
jgi:hypothetical protein